jgi:hypothetical protein
MSATPSHPNPGRSSFAPLRADPPPSLFATWWLRYMLVLAQLVTIAVVVLTAYTLPYADVVRAPAVRAAHALVAVLLVSWSALAMTDAARLVPATRYHRRSSATLAVGFLLLAFIAPVVALVVVEWARERFADDPDDMGVVALAAVAVALCFFVVWLPFRYHARQAHRIGAPGRIVAAWFWVPLLAAVGALAVNAMGLHEWLAEDGFSDRDRMLQVAVVYGLPALTLALSTWRATTVFDEVIELRWLRWKTEWEQTLAAMAAQPLPGPEPSPAVDDRAD